VDDLFCSLVRRRQTRSEHPPAKPADLATHESVDAGADKGDFAKEDGSKRK